MGRDKRASRQALSQLEAPGSSQPSGATTRSTASASQRSTPVTSSTQQSSRGRGSASRSRGSASRGRGGRIANRQALQESESEEESSESEEEEQTPVRKVTKGRGGAVASKRKNLKGFVVSDDEEVEFATTVGKSRSKNPNGGVVDETNSKENLINNVLVYILSKQNRMWPFERSEIVRDVMGKQNRTKFKEVISQVQFILKETFLLKLIGLEDMKSVGSSAETFLLINTVPSEILEDSVDDIDKATNFLYVILTMIYMEGAPLDADRLWSALVKLEMCDDLCPERENLEKFLKEEYLKKHYLDLKNYTKTGEGTRKSTYEWGLRGHYEFCKMTILRDVAKKMNVRDIKSFTYAYAEAKKQMQVYGTVCRAAYRDREGESTYSTTTDDDASGGQRSRNTSQDVSQLETQSLDEF